MSFVIAEHLINKMHQHDILNNITSSEQEIMSVFGFNILFNMFHIIKSMQNPNFELHKIVTYSPNLPIQVKNLY